MQITNARIIAIIEREYLIAIDLQRIIEENFNCEVQIMMPDDAAEKLCDLEADLLLLDAEIAPLLVPRILKVQPAVARRVILLTLDDVASAKDLPVPVAAVVSKPFTDEQIVQAVASSLSIELVQRE